MRIEPIELLYVELDWAGERRRVGRLARQQGRIYFEYDPDFVAGGISLSPYQLPLEQRLFSAAPEPFEGLYGVFNDSLPDGWGRLLLDRKLAARGLTPAALTPLDRLAYVGSRGLGALRYRPELEQERTRERIDLDELAGEVHAVLEGEADGVLSRLLALGGSSGGARPKALLGCNAQRTKLIAGPDVLPPGFTHWMVKFRSSADPVDIGAIEFAYSQMARAAGIEMAETHLFPAAKGPGYFGTSRFDRRGDARVHVHTACGLLHADHRMPSIDYVALLTATRQLTRHQREVDKMFRRMVFNVLAYNRDDHTRNHAFLLDERGEWSCSPAYDLTYSSGPGGEQSLLVAGEGRAPGEGHLQAVAQRAGISEATQRAVREEVKAALGRWPELASEAGVSRAMTKMIGARLGVTAARKSARPPPAAKPTTKKPARAQPKQSQNKNKNKSQAAKASAKRRRAKRAAR